MATELFLGFGFLPSKETAPYFLLLMDDEGSQSEDPDVQISLKERWEIVSEIFETESLMKLCFNSKECIKCVQSVFLDGNFLSLFCIDIESCSKKCIGSFCWCLADKS